MASKYRADQVGSLLRPQELLDLRHDLNTPPEILREKEDQEILRVLGRQKDLGFTIFTDGELRRRGFMSDFHESVEGLDHDGSIARAWAGTGAAASVKNPRLSGVVVSKIRQTKRLTQHESAYLKQHSPGDIKMTLPTANQFPAIAYQKGLSDRAYPTYSDFLWDIVPIIKAEIKALVDEGIPYVQIDAPRYSYYIDPKWRRYVQDEMGMDPSEAL